jgi:hypothetical protein
MKKDKTPCIFGSIDKQRWLYVCAKQLIERLIYREGAENGLEFSIVWPFNWLGPRMDFVSGVDGPQESVPCGLACFSNVRHLNNIGWLCSLKLVGCVSCCFVESSAGFVCLLWGLYVRVSVALAVRGAYIF